MIERHIYLYLQLESSMDGVVIYSDTSLEVDSSERFNCSNIHKITIHISISKQKMFSVSEGGSCMRKPFSLYIGIVYILDVTWHVWRQLSPAKNSTKTAWTLVMLIRNIYGLCNYVHNQYLYPKHYLQSTLTCSLHGSFLKINDIATIHIMIYILNAHIFRLAFGCNFSWNFQLH